MPSKCPPCFNEYCNEKKCVVCIYTGSCRYSTENTRKTEKKNKVFDFAHVSHIEMEGESHPNKIQMPTILNDFIEDNDTKLYSRDELIAIVSMILRFSSDRVVCAVLSDRVSTGDKLSEIAERMGKTRQYIDRKLADAFANIFGWRQTRVKDSKVLKLSTNEFLVYKYYFKRGFNITKTAGKSGLHRHTVRNYIQKLQSKGFKIVQDE